MPRLIPGAFTAWFSLERWTSHPGDNSSRIARSGAPTREDRMSVRYGIDLALQPLKSPNVDKTHMCSLGFVVRQSDAQPN